MMGGVACDDEVPSTPSRRVGSVRDASMIISQLDAMPSGGSDQPSDMGMSAGEVAGSEGGSTPECSNGEERPLPGCGLEVCVLGTWETQSQSAERCNGHDDDCDQRIDETFTIGGTCFIDDESGCRLMGVFACNPDTETGICDVSSATGAQVEVCDGLDNDCDQMIDEDFTEDTICCTTDEQCPIGVSCSEGTCGVSNPDQPIIDPSAPLGTCANPIMMNSFGSYPADGSIASANLSVSNCTGDPFTDGILDAQTGAGSEVVFAFSLSQTQYVRFNVDLSLSYSVLYAFEGQCRSDIKTSLYCDQSIIGLLDEPARPAVLSFEAQANTLYYVVLDTKFDVGELLTLLGLPDLSAIPYIFSFNPGP